MNTKSPAVTLKSVWAALQESDRQRQENERILTEKLAETDQILNELVERQDEADRQRKETARFLITKFAKLDEQLTRLTENVQNLNSDVGGMGNSNGAFAEEFFFSLFEQGKRECFREKFDGIDKNLEGDVITDEYDIVLFNSKSVGIIEVKYKARQEHIPKVLRKAETFRINYPKYKHHRIYLALAAMIFEDDVETDCLNEGIAIIKQKGDTVVMNEKNLKVF